MSSPPPHPAERPTPSQRVAAWMVHGFTASGAVLALLALLAIEQRRWLLCLLWLFAALVVDGVDGWFARRLRVKERAPRIDGDTLDLVVDYLTYVFVPTLFILHAGLVPAGFALPLAALIQISALYHFARGDMKTSDNYFQGFPALWNIVALYLFVIDAGPAAGALVVAGLAFLTFAPVHFVHPLRVRDFGAWLPLLAAVWTLATLALLWPGWSAVPKAALLSISVLTAAALIALGLVRTVRGPRNG